MGDENKDQPFDIKFTALPPELVVKLWTLALDADTGKVGIAYKPGGFTTNLNYNYSGKVSASLGVPRLAASAEAGFTPSTESLDLGLVYRGFKFNATQNFQKNSTGLSLGFGAPLLPFPDELQTAFQTANAGFLKMAKDSNIAMNNPLAFYRLHSDDASAIGNAISMGQKIAAAQSSKDTIGASLRLNFTPGLGFTIYGGIGVKF
jgi:hypothetical protein